MEKIKRYWEKVSYEIIIFGIFMFQFLIDRPAVINSWPAGFNLMDYSMGFGSRLLVGTVYRFFYGDYCPASVMYKYICIGVMIVILIMSIVLGQLIRHAIKAVPACRNVIWGVGILYLAAPFSMAYVWNWQNLGRFDVYMLMIAILCVLAALVIRNFYVKIIVVTVLGVIGLAVHQGFALLYYPMVFSVLCYDVFSENRIHMPQFIGVFVSGLIEVGCTLYFQFFSHVNFESSEELYDYLLTRTSEDMDMTVWSLETEYFQDLHYQMEGITKSFFLGDKPFQQLFFIFVFLSPVIILYLMLWKDVFHHVKANNGKLLQCPYLYMLLSNFCYLPTYIMMTDWGRHLAPQLAMPVFIVLFYLAKGDAAMKYACGQMDARIRKYPWFFVLMLVWLANLSSFGARYFLMEARQAVEMLHYGLQR